MKKKKNIKFSEKAKFDFFILFKILFFLDLLFFFYFNLN